MAKKSKHKKEATISVHFGLKDRLDGNSLAKLQHAQKEWKEQERAIQEEKAKKIAEARRQQEKNKTFADLFEESNLDWRSFK